MVLRVQQIRASVLATAATRVPVAVATPERCPRKLSAVRSAVRIDRVRPSKVATTSPASTRAPSAPLKRTSNVGSTSLKVSDAACTPASRPPSRATTWARALASDAITAREVMSPPEPRSSSRARRTIGSMRTSGRSELSLTLCGDTEASRTPQPADRGKPGLRPSPQLPHHR